MARISVPRQARPHQSAPSHPPRASLKQQLILQLACGDTAGARNTRLLLAESRAREPMPPPSTCHAVVIEDGQVVETMKMTATPGARALFDCAKTGDKGSA